ncbi:MAG: tRNA 4-thiouridine(8) synthase ThiI [Candidatus Omnitrophota bacterium]
MKKKAIALISGGLDSLLAARLVAEQGIEVAGIVFVMPFASRDIDHFKEKVSEAARGAGITVRFEDISGQFLRMLKNPRHGYGANINPCIDCKIMMLSNARRVMKQEGADFIITGEVLGEMPMSQRKEALNIIEKESALKGYLLRPLSAKLLRPVIAEEKGIVDREKLMAIEGRSRKPQLALARKFGITKFFSPAGGCLLTDPIFTEKLKDLIEKDDLTPEQVALLKYGRHFRLDDKTKIIVGRDEKDNDMLIALKKDKDIIIRLVNDPGPYALLRGKTTRENILKAASFVVSHSRKKEEKRVKVEYWKKEDKRTEIEAEKLPMNEIVHMRVNKR